MRALLVAVGLALTLGACNGQRAALPVYELSGQTMGTSFSIKLVTPGEEMPDKSLLQRDVTDVLERIDDRMSTWQPDSELSLFNSNPSTDWINVSAEFCAVIEAALDVSSFTSGAFDITVGPLVNLWGFGPTDTGHMRPPADALIEATRQRVGFEQLSTDCDVPAVRKAQADVYLDLSGYAKGYAVDQVAGLLDEREFTNYLVEIGGELRMRGKNASNQDWAIAVEKPVDTERAVQTIVRMSDRAMATSGDYRNFFEFEGQRYSHTIDSRTGRPVAHNAAAVTIVSGSAALADALATALLVLGPDEGFDFAEQKQIAAFFLLRDNAGIEEKATTQFKVLTGR